VRRAITVQPVVLVWLSPLAPGYVAVFPALHRQRLPILAVRRAGVGRILRCLIRRHKVIIPLTSSGPRRSAICRIPNPRAAQVSFSRWPSQSKRQALRVPGCPPELPVTAPRAWARGKSADDGDGSPSRHPVSYNTIV